MTIETSTTTVGEWEGTHKPIVVGVDGSEPNQSAVAWAAHEAAALGCAVELVTALPRHPRGSVPGVRTGDQEALDMLADARHRVRHVVDEQTVATVAHPGSAVHVLLQHAAGARLVVVGRRGLGGLGRAVLGSTSTALAGRCQVPVAIIPDGWDVEDRRGGPVVVGVDPDHPDHRPLHVAFARARRLRVPLVAVHGRVPSPAYEDDTATLTGSGAGTREDDSSVDMLLAFWSERFPQIQVRPMHAPLPGAEAVLEAAEIAQVVVLGRHEVGMLGGFTLGSVARPVLHQASCPVVVVPAEPSRAG